MHVQCSSPLLRVIRKDQVIAKLRIRPCLVFKKFQDFPSHRIFEHIHEVLNIVLKNNQLYSLAVNDEMNLLSLISLRLDTN